MGVKDQTIDKFLEEVVSKKPTPGGGAVAAVVGAMAAALVEMVCELTKTLNLQDFKTQAKELRQKLLKLADEDCLAFEAVMAAYKSKIKVKEALLQAIVVPQKTKTCALQVEKLAKQVAKVGNKNAYSDAVSAVYLARAAVKAAEENIEINQKALAALS